MKLTAFIEREYDGYASICPEMEIASQGDSVEEALDNLIEALELFFEVASDAEIDNQLHKKIDSRYQNYIASLQHCTDGISNRPIKSRQKPMERLIYSSPLITQIEVPVG